MNNRNMTILQRYTDNPRIQASRLSAELKISKNSVIERIKKLKEKKMILDSTCFPNYFKLGFAQHILFIKTSKLFQNPELIKKIELNLVIEIVSLLGKYNVYIKFISKNEQQKQEFIEMTINSLEAEDYELVQISYYDLIPAKKYKRETKEIPLNYKPSNYLEKEIKCDLIDLKIMEYLTKNAEHSLVKIADKLNLSPQVVAYRFKNMLKKNVILRFYGYTDIFNANLQLYFLRFELTKPTESLKLFKQFIADPCIQDISLLNHKQNFFCTLEAESRKVMLESVQNLLSLNRNVKSIEIDIFLNQIYYNFFPEIIKQNFERLKFTSR